jgi:hypothetical protein
VLPQQNPRDLLVGAGVGEQLCPEQASRLATNGGSTQHLEPPGASSARGSRDQHCLAGSWRSEESQDSASASSCTFQERIDLTEFCRPPHRLHMRESRASELVRCLHDPSARRSRKPD